MRKIRTILVDDEPLALRGLAIRLEPFEDIEIVGEARNGREAIKAIKADRPDLVFLDIQMPGLDGFGVIKGLIGTQLPIFVFVTAYDQYALGAFDAHALDYLLKPVDEARMTEAINRVREHIRQRTAIEQNARLVDLIENMDDPPETALSAILEETTVSEGESFDKQLHIKDRGRITIVDVNNVDYIDAAGDYMCIHEGQKTHILRETMKTMEAKLDPARFRRVHRSTIVNLDRVTELRPHANGEYFLILEGGGELKVSRTYKSVVGRFL